MATGSLFVSYRSGDLHQGVAKMHSTLSAAFGEPAVVRDQDAFVPGADWLPQLRASVAASDLVVSAIGPAWIASFSVAKGNAGVDFVREELLIARELGKPVLPVRLGVKPELVRSVLPQELRWLDGLQQVAWRGPSDTPALVRGIRSLSGLVPRFQPDGPTASFVRSYAISVLSLAWRRLNATLWRPTGAAAASLRPGSGNLAVALAEACLALGLVILYVLIDRGDLGLYALGRFVFALGATAVLLAIGLGLAATFKRQQVPLLSLLGWGLHVASGLFVVGTLWAMALFATTSDEAHSQINTVSEADRAQFGLALDKMMNALTPGTILLLMSVSFACTLHMTVGAFGAVRAAAVTLGFRRRFLLWPAVPLVMMFVSAASWWLATRQDTRTLPAGKLLPLTVQLSSPPDRQTVEGYQPRQLQLSWIDVRISKVGEQLHIEPAQVEIHNRGAAPVRLRSVRCAFGVMRSGNFEWTDPLVEGQAALSSVVQPGGSLRREGLRILLPLTSATPPGLTALQCYVDVADGISHPLWNGQWNVLRW
ncbi:MAG: hypothetical protein AD742_18490 [Methylibium sp. NZG]|nr:MAG: hypothetical protein AD742_18490 [Methylibium sp. NZG]